MHSISTTSAADLPSQDIPAEISADTLTYDQEGEIVTASGSVEIKQGKRTLSANEVTYNIKEGRVFAKGDVILIEPDGEAVFAEEVEFDDQLRDGFIEQVKVLFTDQSRLTADDAERSENRYVVLRNGTFSPCKLCRDNPEKAPLWQIRAKEVTHDQEEKTIEYEDAWIEIFGVPVLYTPYFSHPDPTVERQSGFLAPSFGGGDNLGFTFELPYFWAIDDTKDFTFTPLVTTKQSVVLGGEYRQLFENGALSIAGSGTVADRETESGETKNDQFRGHIDAKGRFDLDSTWRTGFDIRAATDDTYLRLYDFSADRTLTNRLFIEGFHGRSYSSADAYAYQGLRDGDENKEFPIVVPSLNYNFVGQPDDWSGRFDFDAGVRTITRIQGRDDTRLSFDGGYDLPLSGYFGDIYTLKANVQAQAYWTEGFEPGNPDVNPSGAQGSDVTGRILPQFAFDWRLPFIQENEGWQQLLEPRFQVVAAPPTGNPNEIPNEDSIGFELDDANLFELNRFPGLDVADSGSRVDYGLGWHGTWDGGTAAEAFVGQSYQFIEADDDIFPDGSGVGDAFSDFVGRVQFSPLEEFNLQYRFRLDKDSLNPQRSEVEAQFGVPAFSFDVEYLFASKQASDTEFGDREELNFTLSSQLTENWSAFGSHRRDLEEGRALSWSFGMGYEDECFTIDGVFRRRFFDDREIEPENTFFLEINFKHLGGLQTS